MKRKYKRKVNGRSDRNRLGVEFGGEVTLVRLALTRFRVSTACVILTMNVVDIAYYQQKDHDIGFVWPISAVLIISQNMYEI